MLRSMSATNMSMPFLDKVNVQANQKDKIVDRKALKLNLSTINHQQPPKVISHQRIASTRTENMKKQNRELLPPMGNTIHRNRITGMN